MTLSKDAMLTVVRPGELLMAGTGSDLHETPEFPDLATKYGLTPPTH